MDDPTRSFADINGLRLYHEIHGSGRPVVLLHGGLQTIDLMFGQLLPTLAARRQVIAVELQGHGHTADTDRTMSIDQLADDVAALLAHLGIEETDIFGSASAGWSDGRSSSGTRRSSVVCRHGVCRLPEPEGCP